MGRVPLICGIDFDTHAVHLVLLPWDSENADYYPVPLTGATAFERARNAAERLDYFHGFDLIAIESPKSNRFGTAVALARIQGVILAAIDTETTVLELPPHEWRRECGLKGNASKDEVRAKVWEITGGRFTGLSELDGPTQDACDAYCIAYAAREMCRRNAPEAAA